MCRNCAKKGRPCHYHVRPRESAIDGQAQSDDRPADQATLSIRDGQANIISTRPLIPDLSPDALADQTSPPSVAEQNELVYAHPPTDSGPFIVHNAIQTPQSTRVPNLCAILQHTNFPGRSNPPSQTDSSAHTPTHPQPFEEPVHQHSIPIRQSFYVADPIQLSPPEVAVFRNYVERVSKWVFPSSP